MVQLKGRKSSKGKNGPKKPKQPKKKSQSSSHAFTDHETAWIESKINPFQLKHTGLRVPDGDLEATAVTYHHAYFNNAQPYINTTANTTYVLATCVPGFTGNTMKMFGRQDTSYQFTETTGGTSGSLSWTGSFALNSSTSENGLPSLSNASFARVAGGGVRLNMINHTGTATAWVGYSPLFNGDAAPTYFESSQGVAIKKWALKHDKEIIIPWPVRNSSNAYDYVVGKVGGRLDGNSSAHYPADDIGTGGTTTIFKSQAVTAADNTAAYNQPLLYSQQSGMGAVHLAIIVPPNCGFSLESIDLIEAKYQTTGAASVAAISEMKSAPSSQAIMEVTSNVFDQAMTITKAFPTAKAVAIEENSPQWTPAHEVQSAGIDRIAEMIGMAKTTYDFYKYVTTTASLFV